MGSCSEGLWGMGKKNLKQEEKGEKKSFSGAEINHPRLRTLERSIHPPGTRGIAHTTHVPLAAPCVSLWIAGTQQWPLPSSFVLSRSPPCSPEQLHQQPQGKQRHKTLTKIHLVQLLDLPGWQCQPFLPQGEVGEEREG